MILTCPECGTQYVVKDGAIPPDGRQVRCAACKHSWHQDPEDEAAGEPDEVAAPFEDDPSVGEAETDMSSTNDMLPEEADGGEPERDADWEAEPAALSASEFADAEPEPEPAEPVADEPPAEAGEPAWRPAREPDDDFSPFADRSVTIEPQRRRMLPLLLTALLLIGLAAAFWFLAPQEWRARLGLGEAGRTPLQLMLTHSDRQPLESGNELLAVTGRVINPTDEAQTVPPIQAQLRSRTGELIYSWTIAPPARTLPPGASATFNSAEVDVPAGGDDLTLSLGEPAA